MVKVVFDSKGWFGFCPCYFAELHSDAPHVMARYGCLEWLLTFSTFMFQTIGMVMNWIMPGFEGGFPLHITGRVEPPIIREL